VDAWHEQQGARIEGEVVVDYGDAAAEARALREGAGLYERHGWSLRRWTGDKRVTFLHNYITQEVRREPGQGAYGCVLNVKGGTVGDLWVALREDDLLAWCSPRAEQPLYKHLKRYAIFDKVKMEDAAQERALLSVAGPQALALVEGVIPGELPQGPLDHRTIEGFGELVVVRDDWLDVPGVTLIVTRARAGELVEELCAAGVRPVGQRALEGLRVERGVPLYGVDISEKTIPVEAGLEAKAIDYDKGCYTGQEVIVRIKHRGKVNRRLVGLRLPAEAEVGAALFSGEKEVGTLTSAVPAEGGARGLTILHRKYEVGAELRLGSAEGPAAEVVELPFSAS